MNMTALRDNLKDGYKEMLRVANQCDRERIDYRGDLPTAPIREFKAAAVEFYEIANAVCIKSNVELDKLTKPASGKAGGTDLPKLPTGTEQGEPEPDKPNEPNDLITLSVAVKNFRVSKTTLRRAIKDGRLEKYPQKPKSKNSPLKVSENAVAKEWPKN